MQRQLYLRGLGFHASDKAIGDGRSVPLSGFSQLQARSVPGESQLETQGAPEWFASNERRRGVRLLCRLHSTRNEKMIEKRAPGQRGTEADKAAQVEAR